MTRNMTLRDMLVELKGTCIGIVDDGHPIPGLRRPVRMVCDKLERTKLSEVADMHLVPTPTSLEPFIKPRLNFREVLDLLTVLDACV